MLPCCNSRSDAENPSADAAESLLVALNTSEVVTFHFVSRTGDYDYDEDEIRKAATVSIIRRCGRNCSQFMEAVLEHLSASQPVSCEAGQQNILVDLDGEGALVFSYSGRMALFQNECFISQTSVSDIFEQEAIFFQ